MSRYTLSTDTNGVTVRTPVPARFIFNCTDYFLSQDDLEDIMQVWERSPVPPTYPWRLTMDGLQHARQQALKERLKAKWATSSNLSKIR